VFAILLGLISVRIQADETEDREVKVSSQSKDIVKFESKYKSEDEEERAKLYFEVRTNDGEYETILRYEGKSKTEDSKEQVVLQYRLELEKIIEFQDSNGNKQWDSGEEVDIIDLDANELSWNDIVCVQNGESWNCTVSSTDGTVYCAVHLIGTMQSVSGETMHPTSLKLDIHVNKANKRSDTYIALVFKVKAKEKMETKEQSTENEEGITKKKEKEVNFGDGTAFFSWATEATINGNTVEVLHSPLQEYNDNKLESGEACYRIVFVFDSTAVGAIVWDPRIGVNDGSFLLPSFLLIAAIISWLSFH
jgi:hypothetical protein